ncbi:hypothetical protein TcarDRAFT_0432 [Thermosinus carboxydivorans Nor1]|uniref:Uncharacterized protein n=1 Tax=Thermosinus carboxydivorans Nor1 TaxID=401526 RepID=A1HT89_9FIRM|nr:DUF456 family protein [Thermosinus carboxydivorans]EAX46767.1 hypothetical protein TcarDRAFT_0432 [Thermosinus carboxydivorans Nor1]
MISAVALAAKQEVGKGPNDVEWLWYSLGIILLFLLMLSGLVGTLSPKIPGTVIIFVVTVLYGAATEFSTFRPWLTLLLCLLMLTAEVGGRWLRVYLTRQDRLSRVFCTNAAVGNIAGIVAADAIFGPIFGIFLWELVAGKTFMPRWNTVAKVLVRLVAAAALRFICAILMIILIFVYIIA